MSKKKELLALINLLDDPDETIFNSVRNRILEYDIEVVKSLEVAWEVANDGLKQSRLLDIIHEMQFVSIKNELIFWKTTNKSTLEAYIILSKYQYPNINDDKIKESINQLVKDIWLEINDNLTALEKVRVINHIIFDIHKFKKNNNNPDDIKNYFINNLIEKRKGNILSIGLLYSIISEKLNLPIKGVNLPQHFVLAYCTTNELEKKLAGSEVLFYINPLNRGTVFSSKEIDLYLKQIKVENEAHFYKPISKNETIMVFLDYLMNAYASIGQENKAIEIEELLLLLQDDE